MGRLENTIFTDRIRQIFRTEINNVPKMNLAIHPFIYSIDFWNIVDFIHSGAERFFHRERFPRRCLPSSVRHWHEMARLLAAC